MTGREWVGGLVGSNGSLITASYATGRVTGQSRVGGLVGDNGSSLGSGRIVASYATGRVTGREWVGGLVGSNVSFIEAGYATGRVTDGLSRVGGLVGDNGGGTITASYWDTRTSGRSSGSNGTGQTTTQLQTPTGYGGIYADWDVDLDNDGTNDDPWHFGSGSQYPALQVDFDGDGTASWQEFGHQLRAGPTALTVTAETGPMELSWTAVDVSDWTPAPDVTYTVSRHTGTTDAVLAQGLTSGAYTDPDVTRGTTYTYQVAAVVDGGEATRGGLVEATAPNQSPAFAADSLTRTIAENPPAGEPIGEPVAATDPDRDLLTYSLGGPDAAAFTITGTTGQLRAKDALDYETRETYEVTVKVRDSVAVDGTADMATDDEITVTITVTDVNEAPVFDASLPTTYSVAEKTPRGQPIGVFSATDPDTRTPDSVNLTYSLSGTDAAVFFLDPNTGELQTREPLDYESRHTYQVTVAVRDGKDVDGEEDLTETDAEIIVTIDVLNVDEAGMVALSSAIPQEKRALTATLSDLDGGLSTITWQWARSPDQATWTDLPGAMSIGAVTASYTPDAPDVGQYLRATATYTDGQGSNKRAQAETSLVQAAPQVRLVLSADSITEGGTGNTVTVTAELMPAAEDETVVELSEMREHYTLSGTSLTIPLGATQSNAVTLTATDNAVDGPEETKAVPVTGILTRNTLVTAPAPVTLTITDEDTRGVMVTPTELTVNEGSSETYEVALTSEPTDTVTVTVTAPTNTDVTVNRTELVFQPERWNTAQPVAVAAAQDSTADDEPATITHTVSGGDYTTTPALAVATVAVTVKDDERPSTAIVLSVQPPTVEEGSSRTVTVRGTLNGAPRQQATPVEVEVTADTATQGTDFTAAPASFVLTIPAATQSGTATFTLTPVDDSLDEPDETVTVSGSTTGLDVTETPLTITDTDAPPTVELVLTPVSINENGEQSTVTAMLSHPSSTATEVVVTVPAGADAVRQSGTTLTIAAGETASTGNVTLTAVDNATDAQDTVVTVSGQAENALGADGPAAVMLTITDDDPPEVEGESAPKYVEYDTAPVATYTATNPAGGRLMWSLSGTDANDFRIDRNGVLRFASPPDFEASRSHVYQVTVVASDGTLAGTLDVTVTVQDALGTVRLSLAQPRIIAPLSATVNDPDGVETVTEWCWERSRYRDFQTDISLLACTTTDSATATYQPEDGDLGHYLRATVTYTDGDGMTKEVMGMAAELVSARPLPSPHGAGNSGGGGGSGEGGSRDLHGNTAAQATRVRLGSTAPWPSSTNGQINTGDDADYFQLTVPHAGVLVVETTGSTDTIGTVWQAGEELASADHGGVRQNFRLSPRVRAGSVVVAVAGNGRTGSYTLETHLVVGYLENPGADSFQSGIGVLSGWVCDAEVVEIELNGMPQEAAYGTERLDTAGVCGDVDNGFGLLFNWNLVREGEHEVVALVDGVELGRATVTVTTLGEEFVRGVEGECLAEDFPSRGETITLLWQEAQQNFVIAGGRAPRSPTQPGTAGGGFLENPSPNSFQSGIGVISGWVCAAEEVEITLGDLAPQVAGYGTERLDTQAVCGDTDNGFGLLFNWNLLGDGEHTVLATVDGIELGRARVRVTTLGEEFVRGTVGECVVEDFPSPGEAVTLTWQQNQQNFVITAVE